MSLEHEGATLTLKRKQEYCDVKRGERKAHGAKAARANAVSAMHACMQAVAWAVAWAGAWRHAGMHACVHAAGQRRDACWRATCRGVHLQDRWCRGAHRSLDV